MKVTVLSENTACRDDLKAEHGLSLYIETNDKKILYDMGASDAFLYNAKMLKVDLSLVDIAVLSHAHYDHGGGISAFFEVNKKAKLYLSKQAYLKCFSGDRYIGIDHAALKANKERLVLTDDFMCIDEGIRLYSLNENERFYPMQNESLYVLCDGEKQADEFLHEQYLEITEGKSTLLFSSCSHKGIINIAKWSEADIIIGGFHFFKTELSDFLAETAHELLSLKKKYYTCHCTGMEQYLYMKKIMGDCVEYISCGHELNF